MPNFPLHQQFLRQNHDILIELEPLQNNQHIPIINVQLILFRDKW